jgi:hypothetical protein
MWEVENQTPFAADGVFVRDCEAREVWVVAIRATFRFDSRNRLIRPREQQPPILAPQHLGKPGQSSLRYDTDFVLRRPATDVIAHGIAHAPGGAPARSVDVGMRVAGRTKGLRVHGPRVWERRVSSVVPGPAASFAQMPKTYELGYGGWDPQGARVKPPLCFAKNPVGRGFARVVEGLVGQPACSVEPIDQPAKAGILDGMVAGFGPIDRSWQPRASDAGTYDQAWQDIRAPLFPLDYNERFCRQAPADQRLDRVLQPGELIETLNLVPFGRLAVAVPRIEFRVLALFSDREMAAVPTLDTVIIESEGSLVRFVWRAAIECHGREDSLQRSLVQWSGERAWQNE